MADPAGSFPDRRSPPEGVGPYRTGEEFAEIPALAVGETYRVDLRRFKNGRYVSLSEQGYDVVNVVNNSGRTLTLRLNDGASSFTVPSNVSKAYDHVGTYVFEVENAGDSAVSNAGDIVVEIQKEPLGADEQARRRAGQNPVASVVEHFTGLPLGGR